MSTAAATTGGSAFLLPLSTQKVRNYSQNTFSAFSKQLYINKSSTFTFFVAHTQNSFPRSILTARSSATPAVVEEEEEAANEIGSSDGHSPSPSSSTLDSTGPLPPFGGCKACGREEIERGCNGEGRIQGGIATVPGFGWWPIKAYRPCPAFVASGGRYRRSGQSMDEVVSGRGVIETDKGAQSSKKKKGFKR